MNIFRMTKSAVLAFAAVCFVQHSSGEPQAESREVLVRVKLLDPYGAPLGGAAVGVEARGEWYFGITGDDGIADVHARVLPGGETIRCGLAMSAGARGGSNAAARARELSAKFRELTQRYAFDGSTAARVDDRSDTVHVTIQPRLASVVTLQLQSADGSPVQGTGIVEGGLLPVKSDPNGMLILGGIQKGQSTSLFIVTQSGAVVHRRLDAGDTLNDTHLGVAREPQVPQTCEVRVLQQNPAVVSADENDRGGITLVGIKGDLIYTFPVREENEPATRAHNTAALPRVAPGTYYVVPGLFLARHHQVKMVRLAQASLGGPIPGVPIVEAVPDKAVELRFDAQAVRAQIARVPAPD